MEIQGQCRRWIWLWATTLAAWGCGAQIRPTPFNGAPPRVIINGAEVAVMTGQTALDLLLNHGMAARLLERGALTGEQLLVIVDGLAIPDGPRRLQTFSAQMIDSIEILRSTQAMLRYGSKAAGGAIAILTIQSKMIR